MIRPARSDFSTTTRTRRFRASHSDYENMSRFDEAIAAYKKVLEFRPEDKDALYWVCLLDLVSGQNDDALNYLPKLKRLNTGTGKEIEMLMNRTARQPR